MRAKSEPRLPDDVFTGFCLSPQKTSNIFSQIKNVNSAVRSLVRLIKEDAAKHPMFPYFL